MDTEKDKTSFRKTVKASYSDKLFLLNFVMSAYLGPDVYSDNPRCSSFQRLAKRLPPYTSNNLGSSFLRVSQLESLYYYVLRNANSDLVVKPDLFYMYLKGNLALPSLGPVEDHRRFTSFFPLSLHEQKKYSSNYEIVKGIVLIDDPVTTFMKKEDLERFKYLSGIDDLRIDAKECLIYRHGHQKGGDDTESPCLTDNDKENVETVSEEKGSARFGAKYRRRGHHSKPKQHNEESMPGGPSEANGSAATTEKPNRSNGTVLMGVPPQEVNIVDIGENENAYLFRVALPGVRRDFCEFSCDIKSNGEVQIEGTVSGGSIIRKRSRVFHMFIQQLWPAGPFTVSFNLPGPVDPRLFTPNFRNDGIFEGIVVKQK